MTHTRWNLQEPVYSYSCMYMYIFWEIQLVRHRGITMNKSSSYIRGFNALYLNSFLGYANIARVRVTYVVNVHREKNELN